MFCEIGNNIALLNLYTGSCSMSHKQTLYQDCISHGDFGFIIFFGVLLTSTTVESKLLLKTISLYKAAFLSMWTISLWESSAVRSS